MKQQKGEAFILVLIFLLVGSLLIAPVLQFTSTGLRSQRISEDVMAKQNAADSALQDALWRMLNEGLLSSLNPANPTYSFEFGVERYKVDVKVPTVPQSIWTEQAGSRVKVEVQPNWLQGQTSGTPAFIYVIRIDQQHWDLDSYGFALPLGLTYVASSSKYKGPERSTLLDRDALVSSDGSQVLNNGQWVALSSFQNPATTIQPDGRQKLVWYPPSEWNRLSGRRVFIQTLLATGNPGWGVHYVEPQFTGASSTIEIGPTGALGVAIYNVLMDVAGVKYQVVVGYDTATGEFKIVSYQIVG